MIRLLMQWDIKMGREQDFSEFVVREFAPRLMQLGIEPNEVLDLIADLPLGVHQNAPVDVYADATGLEAGATLPVLGAMQGGGFVLHIENTLPATAQIVIRGVVARPSNWWQGNQVLTMQANWLPSSGATITTDGMSNSTVGTVSTPGLAATSLATACAVGG